MRTNTARLPYWKLAAGSCLGLLLTAGCGHSSGSGTASSGTPFGSRVAVVNNTGSGVTATQPGTGQPAPWEPNSQITPGATLAVTKDDVCVSGYSQKVRNVPESVKQQAYANYNVTNHHAGDYEVDHLISLELGGSNSIKNLWPESYKTKPWNAHVKDQLENALHADVCSGKIDLKTAQQEIASDWIKTYKTEFHTDVPLKSVKRGHRKVPPAADAAADDDNNGGANSAPVAALPTTSTPGTGQVWVNLNSGKYFSQGTRYYGKTKKGEYLSEADAKKQGYVAAQGQ
jgi:hypothetical protein